MMISSIDLFFNRDCAVGGGPEVEPPRFVDALVGAVVALVAG